MTKEEIDKTLEIVEETIKTEGYCRAGFAIDKALGVKRNISPTAKMKIAAKSTITEKYKFSLAEDKKYIDFNIFPNPEYQRIQLDIKLTKSNLKAEKRNIKVENRNMIATWLNVAFAIVNIGIVVWQISKG